MSISDQVSMFYNASPVIFERAKDLRNHMTKAEKKLWEHVKGKKILNLRFRTQHPIDRFIADFYCHALKLVIEIDGGIHKSKNQSEYDIGREAEIIHWGVKMIRFTNEEIENDMDYVLNKIKTACIDRRTMLQSPL